MPDDSERDSEKQGQEGVKILPGEWLRRLAERRTRAQRGEPEPEAPIAPVEGLEPVAEAPPSPIVAAGQPVGSLGGSSSEPEPADAIARSAERARRQVQEALSSVRSGIDEAAAESHARDDRAREDRAREERARDDRAREDRAREEQAAAAAREAAEERLRSSTGDEIQAQLSEIQARLDALEQRTAADAEHARSLVVAEAQAARASLAEDAGRLTQQLRAAEEWLSQQRQSLIAATAAGAGGGIEVEGADITVGQAMAAIEAAAQAAEARIAELVERQVQVSEAESRARLSAETENARAILRKQSESIGKSLSEQERKAAEVLSAKAQRRERVMAREEQSRTARRAQETIREAERASRDAEERIAQSAEGALSGLRTEMEKQRRLVEEQIRQDLNRLLEELQSPGGGAPQAPS